MSSDCPRRPIDKSVAPPPGLTRATSRSRAWFARSRADKRRQAQLHRLDTIERATAEECLRLFARVPFRIASCFVSNFPKFARSVSVYDGELRTVRQASELHIAWPVLFHLLMRGEKFVFQTSRFPSLASLHNNFSKFDRAVCIQHMFRGRDSGPMPPVYAPNTSFHPDPAPTWLRSLLDRFRGEIEDCWFTGLNSGFARTNELYVDHGQDEMVCSAL